MKAFKRRIQLTVFIGLVFIILIFLNDYWGISNKQGNGTQGLNTITDTLMASQLPTDTISATETNNSTKIDEVIKNTEEEIIVSTDTITVDTLLITTADSIVKIEEGASQKAIVFNLIEVKRRGQELYYLINGKETNNLVEGLTLLEADKEVILKMSGNITYAEGQEVKTTLEVKEIEYSESNYQK